MDIPGYDAWKTTPPAGEPWPSCYCDECDERFSPSDEMQEGDECPECGGEIVEAFDDFIDWDSEPGGADDYE